MQPHDTTNQPPKEISYGYCHCGCGQKTKIAVRTATKYGWVKGAPMRFAKNHNARIGLAPQERFWAKVNKNGPIPGHCPELGPCWEWRANKVYGYGLFTIKGEKRAHRYSYTLAFGPIPCGVLVCHHCDNRACVRPSHLFLGTQAENIRDRDQKGRGMQGERHHSAKLTWAKVGEIRKLLPTMTQRNIAKMFGVKQPAIKDIAKGYTWQKR